jgi:hypothetical protein
MKPKEKDEWRRIFRRHGSSSFLILFSFLPSQVSQSSSFFRGVILAASDFYVPSFGSVYDALIKHIERYAK